MQFEVVQEEQESESTGSCRDEFKASRCVEVRYLSRAHIRKVFHNKTASITTMSYNDPKPEQAPPIGLPKGSTACEVSIINTTCDLVVPPGTLIEPHIDGHEWLNLPTYSFLITHPSGAQVLFDLGCRKDWENLVPEVKEVVSQRVPGFKVQMEVPDILRAGGVNVDKLKALILSHWHFDHCGNISRLHPSTDLIVGPGFKAAFEPGFPQKATSVFYEEDFQGRNVIEPSFSDGLLLGRYQAHDYFSDGSLYILNVPGHTTGHISALVRTSPDTAIFMGGDVCHFPGQYPDKANM